MKKIFKNITSLFFTGYLGGSKYYKTNVESFLEKNEDSYIPGVYDGVRELEKFPNLSEVQETLIQVEK